MLDFLKRFYRKKVLTSEDDIQRRGYQYAEIARNNPEVRSYLDELCQQYGADPKELDITFASYMFAEASPGLTEALSSAVGDEDEVDDRFELAQSKGISKDLIDRAHYEPIAKALMLTHLRLAWLETSAMSSDELMHSRLQHLESALNKATDGDANTEQKVSSVSEIVIIDERVDSTMVSHWTVYLCVIETSNGIKLCQLQRDILGHVDDYEQYDDEGELIGGVPDEINGKPVFGVEDSQIVGYDLSDFGGYESQFIPFDGNLKHDIVSFLHTNRWDDSNLQMILQNHVPKHVQAQIEENELSVSEEFLYSLPELISGLSCGASEFRYYPDEIGSVSISYKDEDSICTVYAWEGGPEMVREPESYSIADRVIDEIRNQALALANMGLPIDDKTQIQPLDPKDGQWFGAVVHFPMQSNGENGQLLLISTGNFTAKLRGTYKSDALAQAFCKEFMACFLKRLEDGLI